MIYAGSTRGSAGRPGGERAPAEGTAGLPEPERGFGMVEALVALVILSVGLLAIAGIALTVGAQTRAGIDTTGRVLAGQQVLERMVLAGFGSVPTGDTTVRVGGRTFTVGRSISAQGPRWKELRVEVQGIGDGGAEALITRLHAPRPLPAARP